VATFSEVQGIEPLTLVVFSRDALLENICKGLKFGQFNLSISFVLFRKDKLNRLHVECLAPVDEHKNRVTFLMFVFSRFY
jgi:hypothetical protein